MPSVDRIIAETAKPETTVIDLSFARIDHSQLQKLTAAIQQNPNITHINLQSCTINYPVDDLLTAIAALPELFSLNLNHFKLTHSIEQATENTSDAFYTLITQLIAKPSLGKLNLLHLEYTDKLGTAVAAGLQQTKAQSVTIPYELMSSHVEECNLVTDSLITDKNSFYWYSSYRSFLRYFPPPLYSNPSLNQNFRKELLSNNTVIKHLTLAGTEYNQLAGHFPRSINRILKYNTTLQSLTFKNIKLSAKTLTGLFDTLRNTTQLISLTLDKIAAPGEDFFYSKEDRSVIFSSLLQMVSTNQTLMYFFCRARNYNFNSQLRCYAIEKKLLKTNTTLLYITVGWLDGLRNEGFNDLYYGQHLEVAFPRFTQNQSNLQDTPFKNESPSFKKELCWLYVASKRLLSAHQPIAMTMTKVERIAKTVNNVEDKTIRLMFTKTLQSFADKNKKSGLYDGHHLPGFMSKFLSDQTKEKLMMAYLGNESPPSPKAKTKKHDYDAIGDEAMKPNTKYRRIT